MKQKNKQKQQMTKNNTAKKKELENKTLSNK